MKTITFSSWTEFKSVCIDRKNLVLQYEESSIRYTVFALEAGIFLWEICLPKDNGSDIVDFETNYKDKCNYAVGMFYMPFASDNMVCYYDGIELTEITADIQKIYYEIPTDDLFLVGGSSGGENIGVGDWFSLSIVDHNNLLGYGVDFELKKWIHKRFLRSGTEGCVCKTPYAGQPPKHFHVCVEYHKVGSIGQANPKIWIQLDLHQKVL